LGRARKRARNRSQTERERGWIDALRAYFRDHDKVDVETRLRAYNKAMEEMAQRYPDDYEVQVVYALTLQASASKTDSAMRTSSNRSPSWRSCSSRTRKHPGVSHFHHPCL